jgi:hypothetical protein
MKTNKMIWLATLGLTFFIGCQNIDDLTQEKNVAVTNEEVISEVATDNLVDDVSTITEDQFGVQQNLSSKSAIAYKSMLPDCAKVTAQLTNGVWTRIIDFGTTGCTLANGNVLKGKIILTFENNFTATEQKITHRLDGFYHNGKKIEGTQTITRTLKSTALLAEIHPVTTLTLNLTITLEDGKKIERTGTRVREMVSGFATPGEWSDNVFLVWGYTMTKFANGDTLTTTVKENPLRFAAACKLPIPSKGIAVHVKTNAENQTKKEYRLDFGDGECDNKATITIDGVSKEIEIKK